MNAQNQKQLLISLIKDDLVNNKLVSGLNAMGLQAGDYLLHLSDTIFKLMNITDTEKSEALYKRYLELSEHARQLDITTHNPELDQLAEDIYREIVDTK